MIRLATADRPDVALPAGGAALGAVAAAALERDDVAASMPSPAAPLGAWLGGVITRLNNGLFRSRPRRPGERDPARAAVSSALEHHTLRIDQRREEPRYCHAVRLEGLVVGNLHATSDIRQPEVAGRARSCARRRS